MLLRTCLIALLALFVLPATAQEQPRYRWLDAPAARDLAASFAPPTGFARAAVVADSFALWLRHLPLKPDGAPVVLFDGRARDLQQCADAVMRLRAEWVNAVGRHEALAFDFTSGDRYAYADWRRGRTPSISGSKVSWIERGSRPDDRAGLRAWLDIVFTYAGSLSLQRELRKVSDVATVAAGDVLIQGGSPGHAVIVLDVAHDAAGRPAVLLAQSFMPAQSIHVLRNPQGGAWFRLREGDAIVTPDWRFAPADLRRFAGPR